MTTFRQNSVFWTENAKRKEPFMTKPVNPSQNSSYAFFVAFIAAVGGFLFGYDLAIIGGANIFLRDYFSLSEAGFGFTSLGFTTASAAYGCILGPIFGWALCDKFGRRNTLVTASILIGISAIITAIANDIYTFNIFRIMGGVGVGLCSIGSPMYITEISPARKRGALGVMYQLAIVVGSVLAAFAAWALAKYLSENISWRWMFASIAAVAFPFAIMLCLLPKSPRWLVMKNREAEALKVLAKIDGVEYSQTELVEIKNSLQTESGKLSDLIKPGFRIALVVGLLLAFFNNWTGWSGLGGYIPFLFQKAGVSDRAEAILQYVFAYGIMGIFTVAACFLVDRFGRRPLWFFASLLMIGATALVGMVFYFNITNPFVILLAISVCAIPHALALGPLPWLMMSEIFPTHLRAKAVAVTTAFVWVNISLVATVFPIISSYSEKNLPIHNTPTITSSTISLNDTNPDTITDSNNSFITAGFQPDQKINVSGALNRKNNYSFTIAAVTENTITLSEKDTLINESSGKPIKLHVGSVALTFWLFSVICVCAFFFGIKLLPETKGKTLEQIAEQWRKH